MTKYFLLFLTIVSIGFLYEKKPCSRSPASSSDEVINNLMKACDQAGPDTPAYSVCGPYIVAKDKASKEAEKVVKSINETITPEVTAVSGFILKSLYEKKFYIEVKTDYGKPAVSISNNQTIFNWSIEHNF